MKKILVLIMISFIFLTGCGTKKEQLSYQEISASEAKSMIDENNDLLILDVRTKLEYNEGHLKDAINIEHTSISNKISNVTKDLEKTIIIYCRSGARALVAAQALIDLGYKNVYTFGGINSWDYEIVD